MKIFLSWSGKESGDVAAILKSWLPKVIQAIEPYMSNTDILKGEMWLPAIMKELEVAKFGIVCITRDNISAPWVLFEAGAIAITLRREQARVSTLMLGDLKPADIKDSPLSIFQSTSLNNKSDMLNLLKTINGVLESGGLPEERLKESFKTWWPELEKKCLEIKEEIPKKEVGDTKTTEKPSDEQVEKLEELLALVEHLGSKTYGIDSKIDEIKKFIRFQYRTVPRGTGLRPEGFWESTLAALAPAGSLETLAPTGSLETLAPTGAPAPSADDVTAQTLEFSEDMSKKE